MKIKMEGREGEREREDKNTVSCCTFIIKNEKVTVPVCCAHVP